MDKNVPYIPFGNPTRVGNFKLWRSRFSYEFKPTREMLSDEDKVRFDKGEIKLKKQKEDIECINVSNLDGSWMTRIPQTYEMYGMITLAWQWYNSEKEELKKRGEDYLTTVFSNFLWCGSISNGYYHQALAMIATAYAHPELLSDKKKFKEFSKEAKQVIEEFLVWRKEFDKHRNRKLSKEEMRQDETAQEILDKIEQQNNETAEG